MSEKEIATKEEGQIVKLNITNAALDKLKKKFENVPDCTTTEGYEFVRLGIAEMVGERTGLAACKKEKKAEAIAFNKGVDTEYNRVLDILVSIETPLKEAKQEIDAIKEAKKEEKRKAEENRKFKITNRINMIREVVFDAANKSSEDIKKQLDVVMAIEINKADFEEFKVEAERARIDVEVKLEDLFAKAVESEEAAVTMKAEEDRIAKERKELDDAKIENDAEIERVAGIQNNIGLLKDLPFSYDGKDSPTISLAITSLEALEVTEDEYGEFVDEATAAKENSLDRLNILKGQVEEREEFKKKEDALTLREAEETLRLEEEAETKRIADEKDELDKAAKIKEGEDEKLQLKKYNESLAAIESLVGDKKISKAVLDAAIDGAIPNITYA